MAQSRTRSLTDGRILPLLLEFCFPVFLGNLLQQFYSLTDTAIVGQVLGMNALAAVGSVGSLNFLVIGFCAGFCAGFAIPIAQSFGAKDEKEVRRYTANIVWLCLGFAVALTALTALLCSTFLRWMRTPDDIFADANSYILIIFLGIPATLLYNMLAGIIRALGDSRAPVYFLGIAAALNIGLDFLLTLVIPGGVAGTAIATVLAQAISGALCFVFLLKKYPILRIRREEWRISPYHCRVLCGVGVPMGLQFSITAIGCIILQAAVNDLGPTAIAAVSAANRISNFLACPLDALGTTCATFTGQNIGAQRTDRVRCGAKLSFLLGLIYSAIAVLICVILGNPLGELFVGANEPGAVALIYRFDLINCAFYPLLTLIYVFRNTVQGMGYSRVAIFAGLFEMVARSVFGAWVIPAFGFTAACFGGPAAWVFADLFLVPVYFVCIRRTEQQLAAEHRLKNTR